MLVFIISAYSAHPAFVILKFITFIKQVRDREKSERKRNRHRTTKDQGPPSLTNSCRD